MGLLDFKRVSICIFFGLYEMRICGLEIFKLHLSIICGVRFISLMHRQIGIKLRLLGGAVFQWYWFRSPSVAFFRV